MIPQTFTMIPGFGEQLNSEVVMKFTQIYPYKPH